MNWVFSLQLQKMIPECNIRNGSLVYRLISPAIMKFLAPFLMLVAVCASGQTAVERARILYEQKHTAEAVSVLEKVKENDKDFATAQYYLGRIAFDQKRYDDAADYFEEATEAEGGKTSDYYTWLGDSYGNIARDADLIRKGMLAPKMKNAWEKAIALDNKNLNARLSLISFYTEAPGFMGGSMDKAKEMARQIMAINPAQGHRSLGNLYLSKGEKCFRCRRRV